MRKNKLIINVSQFNITDYSSWTLLFSDQDAEMSMFLNMDGKVQDNNQLLELIDQHVAYLKRAKSTILDYHFIFIFPEMGTYDFDFSQIKTTDINTDFDIVCFKGTVIKENTYDKYEVAVDNIKDRNGIWNYPKYSFVFFDVVSALVNDVEIKDNKSMNYKLHVSKSEETKITTITANEVKLNHLISDYKHFLEKKRDEFSIKEDDEKIDVFDADKIDNLDFAVVNPLCLKTFGEFEPNTKEAKNLIEEIQLTTNQSKEYLRNIILFLSKKHSPFTLNNIRLDDKNKRTLIFKNDKRANTEEIKEEIEDFTRLLNNEETESLILPKITEVDVKNLGIFSNNTIGNIENSNDRRLSKQVVKKLLILFPFVLVTIALPLIFSFSLVFLLYSSIACFAIYILALLIANMLHSSKINKFNHKQERAFDTYIDHINKLTKVDFETIKKSLNKRKALVENINILKKFSIERQMDRTEKSFIVHKIDTLLKMIDVKEAIASNETDVDSPYFSIQPFFQKHIKDE